MAKRSERGVGATFAASRARPRARLSRDEIVDAAVAILDAEGPEALTFRRLAADLGAGLGSLYWHVEGKDALLDLAFDRVMGELAGQFAVADDRPWPERLRDGLTELFHLLQRHPWASRHAATSRDRGPELLRVWDRSAQILLDAGFEVEEVFYASAALFSYVVGIAGQAAQWAETTQATRAERLAEGAEFFSGLDPEEFPAFTRVAPIFLTHSEERQFATGLDLLVEGLAARRPPR